MQGEVLTNNEGINSLLSEAEGDNETNGPSAANNDLCGLLKHLYSFT
jgi:hypothetical protein